MNKHINDNDLIQEIYTVEDNIQTIESNLNNNKLKKFTFFEIIKMPVVALLIAAGFAIPIGFFKNYVIVQIVASLCSLKFIGMSILTLLDNLKTKKSLENTFEKSNQLLNETYSEEQEKLKDLKKLAEQRNLKTEKSTHYVRSEVICSLHRKLNLIKEYEINKSKIISYYKKGLMVEVMYLYDYDEEDIRFIEELIKNDLIDEKCEVNKNGKQKTKK